MNEPQPDPTLVGALLRMLSEAMVSMADLADGWKSPETPPPVQTDQPARLLTLDETAKHLGVSLGTVYNLIRRGDLERLKIGRIARIPMSSLNELVANKESRT